MNSLRIDKYLAQLDLVSRREAKKFFRSGRLMVNGYIEYDHSFQIIDGDIITIDEDLTFTVKQSVSILFHKPAGYVCSEIDEWWHLSYKQLLSNCVYSPMLKVAGRLDRDTTGLVLATSDWSLIHHIISSKSGKEKEYKVLCKTNISDDDLQQLRQGVIIDGDYQTLPAKTVKIDSFSFYLTITEGKFHQIKKMCEAIGNECIALQRIRIGDWILGDMKSGEWKFI